MLTFHYEPLLRGNLKYLPIYLFIYFLSFLVSCSYVCKKNQAFRRLCLEKLLHYIIPQMAAVAEVEETEGAVLVGTPAADGVRGWALLGSLLNWVCFIIAALVYVVMFARCFA
jgi:hypothetical protein